MTSISGSTTESRSLLKWVFGGGLVVIALLALGGLSWVLYQQFVGPQESAEIDVGTIPDRFRPRRAAAAPRGPQFKDGITAAGIGFYRVQHGEYYMTLAAAETSFAPTQLMCSRADLLPRDQRQLIRFCLDTANAGFAKNVELQPEQAKKLAEIRKAWASHIKLEGTAVALKLSDEDRTLLRTMWKNWVSAKTDSAKADAQTALLNAMKESGARSVAPTQKHYADLSGEIRKVVTNQMLTRARQVRNP